MKGGKTAKISIILCFMTILFFYCLSRGGKIADTQPPATEKKYVGGFYEKNGEEWISNATIIWLNATDDRIGVNYTYYELWWDSDSDGEVDTMVDNATIEDNSPRDENPTDGEINVKINLSFLSEGKHLLEFYSVDNAGNEEEHVRNPLNEEWHYLFQQNVTHLADNGKMIFGSSPAIMNISGGEEKEIITGSDETSNYYPELSWRARGIWRCFNWNGSVKWAIDTLTDESRSSPAIADIDYDGELE